MSFRCSVACTVSWIPAPYTGSCLSVHSVHWVMSTAAATSPSPLSFPELLVDFLWNGPAPPAFFPSETSFSCWCRQLVSQQPSFVSLTSVKQFPSLKTLPGAPGTLELFSGSCCLTGQGKAVTCFQTKSVSKHPLLAECLFFVLPGHVRKPITSQQIYCSIIMLKCNNLWLMENLCYW